MRVGIVGLPQVGKTSIFNLLTRGERDTSAHGGKVEAHVGIAFVPDPKLVRLGAVLKPDRVTHATVEYVDLPGIQRGEGKAALEGQERQMSAYLHSLKNVDALLHVVRAFDDPSIPHSEGAVDPVRDIDLLELEMIFSDLAIIEKRLERLTKDMRKVKSPDLEMEHSILTQFKSCLEEQRPLRDMELSEEDGRKVKGFTFLTAKPMLVVLNLDDGAADKIPRVVEAFGLQRHASMRRVGIMAVCGKIESEIATLEEPDARIFMKDFGIDSSGLARIIEKSYELMGLISFYTVGEPEVRAWTIPRGTTAQQAAGVIHTDFERGFIKAEVVSFEDMVEIGSFQAARSKGVLRLEGKDYAVREDDVILFRFNL